jgi:hypothetical protein
VSEKDDRAAEQGLQGLAHTLRHGDQVGRQVVGEPVGAAWVLHRDDVAAAGRALAEILDA